MAELDGRLALVTGAARGIGAAIVRQFDMQRRHLLYAYGDTPATRRWIEILRAEVVGQRLFYERYKRFVDDQRGFIEAYLKDPEATLLWSLW